MTATDDIGWDEALTESVEVLDQLHRLLTVEQLYDGWRGELDEALADAARLLDAVDVLVDGDNPTDEPAEASRNPESGTPDDDAVKRCPRCDTVKPVDEFGRNRSAHDGLQTWCKPCMRAYNRRSRQQAANPACGDSTGDVASQSAPARRLTAPTGQPVEPDPDSRPPAHAGSPKRTPSTFIPLT